MKILPQKFSWIALFLFPIIAQANLDADKIVEKADAIRFPQKDIKVAVSITTKNPGKKDETRRFRVLSKGREDSLVVTTFPASERGQILLMKGRELWVFMPNVSQPVRLSLSQRLTGVVANGDIARANFAGDYNAKLEKVVKVKGQEAYLLNLTAVDGSVTYSKVKYWVNKKTFAPIRAEFFSVSNKLLKDCEYTNFKKVLGESRPMRLVMRDATKKGYQSILNYAEIKTEKLESKMFAKDYLKKIDPGSLDF